MITLYKTDDKEDYIDNNYKKKYNDLLDAIDTPMILSEIFYENTPGIYEKPSSPGWQLTIFNALKASGKYRYNKKCETIELK